MRFRILEGARKELREALNHYNKVRREVGQRFKDALSAAFDRIERLPLSCAKTSGDVRICRIKRFPFGLVYVPREAEIVIIAVMHLHRRPGYWKRRLKDLGP